jgi:hypothetical protein
MLGTYHLVYDTGGAELGVAILFLLEPVHFTCATELLKLSGSELCLILKPYMLSTLHEFHCIQTAGVASDRKYLNDKGEEVLAGLTSLENEKTSVASAEEVLALILWVTALGSGKNVDVLIDML